MSLGRANTLINVVAVARWEPIHTLDSAALGRYALHANARAPIRLWPWLINYAVEWHNSLVSSTGSSSADVNISPYQRHTMEAAVAHALLAAAADSPPPKSALPYLIPISPWSSLDGRRLSLGSRSTRLSGGGHALPVLVALSHDDDLASPATLDHLASLHDALRADSPGAPSNHREAAEAGQIWMAAEAKELGNHARNGSWTSIPRGEVPKDRRIHKLIWVYKLKRDGTAKARLCVQGNTLQSGIDYDQTWSSALRYSSARALFAYAARKGCRVRSVDLVAAYLQGKFVDGEVVYCYHPTGYPELDSAGQPMIARVEKPIYGIQQAGRRLQRMLFTWLIAQGFTALDDSDPCVFTRTHEIITIGVYVDNLQIVHSAVLETWATLTRA